MQAPNVPDKDEYPFSIIDEHLADAQEDAPFSTLIRNGSLNESTNRMDSLSRRNSTLNSLNRNNSIRSFATVDYPDRTPTPHKADSLFITAANVIVGEPVVFSLSKPNLFRSLS
jgi:hypothetical protein